MSDQTGITDLENLTIFLQEKVQVFDPSIDTTTGSAFYNQVIQPLLDRLGPDPYNTPIRDFILARLEAEFPQLIIQDGEPIDDYAVKPMQVLLEAFRRQIQQVSNNQSLADPETLTETESNNLGANFFVRRILGGFSIGVARLYYSAPQGAIVTPNNAVFDSNGHRFFPVENQAITSNNMLFNIEDNLYFFDIIVRAEKEGTDYDIDKNTLTGIEELPSVVKVSNKAKFEEGGDKETTEEYISRVENSLTEKSLVTLRGINARLIEIFTSIRMIQVIGYGDPEMMRDILTGESDRPAPYAYFLGSALNSPTIELDPDSSGVMTSAGAVVDTFTEVGAAVGDIVILAYVGSAVYSLHTVTAVSPGEIQVDPPFSGSAESAQFALTRAKASITLSGIPGGILQPQTQNGEIIVAANEVHIGGMVDVFIRAGEPINRETVLEGVLDGSPLHFGVDLESFGERQDEFVQVSELIEDGAFRPSTDRFGDAVTDHMLIVQLDETSDPFVPWKPADEDVGRYVQILPSGAGTRGLLKILEVLGEEYFTLGGTITPAVRCVRVKVELTNQENPAGSYTLGTSSTDFDTDIRIVESISPRNRVRDRDASRELYTSPDVPAGSDLRALGAEVGDSVVIEIGDDAGVYTIRRVLDWLDTGDTLVLDRDLTKTVTPTGAGDGSGLRYRIADELNVDLVSPRVTKIPLGNIFAGDDLSTVAGNAQVGAGDTTNFLLAGVEVGDVLEILEGDDRGTYSIQSVAGASVTLDVPLLNTAFSLDFTVYKAFTGVERPMVRVREIELLDSNSQPTGISIPYGDVIDARALGVFSNRAEGSKQESFTGVKQTGTGSKKIRIHDVNVNFISEGVVAGFRLNILNTDDAGSYVITKVGTGDGLPDNHYIEVATEAAGGVEFGTLESNVHYSIGLPSTGVARLYFQEPTSVQIETGLAGGRINFEEEGTPKEYIFSEVPGFRILPAPASGDEVDRNIRVVRNYEVSSGIYESVLELTDPSGPSVLDLEILVGDIVEVNEQLPFADSGGDTLVSQGIFGKPAGLRTIVGSNRVSIPDNSMIDFVGMNGVYPLVGQILFIDEGPDAGQYIIEEVVNSKTLRLDAVMTASTETIVLKEASGTSRDAELTPGSSSITMEDATDSPGTQIGNFITIFESTRGDLDGTYEIKSIPASNQVELDMDPGTYPNADVVSGDIDVFNVGLFSWVNTVGDTNVGHAFNIYKSVPKQAVVSQVATKRTDIDLPGRGDITTSTNLTDSTATFQTDGVVPGDRLEILAGASAGVYPIATVPSQTAVTIVNNTANLFPVTTSNVPYRVWSGLHGSTKMITVGAFESDNGQLTPGAMTPFKVIRPSIFRVSSTEMAENFDGSFYYVDIQVESLGSGDALNLDRNSRMVVKSGLRADGYTYTVQNNNLTFSPFEQVSLNFDRRFLPTGNSDSPENMTEVSGRNLKVVYETSTTAKLVHDLMRSEAERPVNANPLGRHFLPSYVYTQLRYRGGVAADEVGKAIADYINRLGGTDELEVSDLEAFLTRRGATSIRHPITIAVITHDLDRALVVNRTEDSLGGRLAVPFNGTGRISAFFAILGEGLTVERDS